MRKPIGLFDCQGSYDGDAYLLHRRRPFKHKTTGRTRWKRAVRKRQRREWQKVETEE